MPILPEALVCDANILIDFLDCDESLITSVSTRLVTLHVPVTILKEVDALERGRAEELGLIVEEIPLEYLLASKRLPGCSIQDSSCYYLAGEKGWGCATNEKRLKRHCDSCGIPVVRGFRLILELVLAGIVSRREAEKVGRKIHAGNDRIGDDVLESFLGELKSYSGK